MRGDASSPLGQRRLRRRSAAVVMVVSAMGLTACGGGADAGGSQAQDGGLGTIRVVTSVPNSYPFIAVQAAEQLGTWKGTGLTVKVISGSTPRIGQIMAGHQADVALAGGNTEAANIASGLQDTIMAANIASWDQRIIASTRLHATKPEDLKGKNFGITGAGSPGAYSVYKMAQKLGWSSKDYKTTSVNDVKSLIAALKSGSIDAFAWSSQVAFQMEQQGIGTVVAPAKDFVGPNMLEAFEVSDSYAKDHQKALKVFFEKYFEMVKKLQANPQLAVDVMTKHWAVDPSVAAKVADQSLPLLSTDGKITDSELQGIADAVAFSTGKKTSSDFRVNYKYWQDALK